MPETIPAPSENINWELFAKVLAIIEMYPERHRQEAWHCGTSHCFAGWCELVELKDRNLIPNLDISTGEGTLVVEEWYEELTRVELGTEYAGENAAKLLGLSDGQHQWLFSGARSVHDFRHCYATRNVPTYWDAMP